MSEPVTVTTLATREIQDREALTNAIVHTDAQGHTVLAIPPVLHQKFNVLAPTAVIAQEDPYFRPSFTVVQADPRPAPAGADFYTLQGKLAPTKVLLQKLGDAAGIVWDADKSFGTKGDPEEVTLPSGATIRTQSYTYHAVGYIRKSDGTKKVLTADEEWQPAVALFESKNDKEFIFSLKKRAQMIRSKAMNGVLRQALSISQSYTTADAAKPFFVVSHNWSPDSSDPATAGIIASLLGADRDALYGARPALPEESFTLGNVDVEVIPFDEPAEDAAWPEEVDTLTGEVIDDESAEIIAEVGMERRTELGSYVLTTGDYKGKTLAQVWDDDPEWFGKIRTWRDAQKVMTPPQRKTMVAVDAFYAVAGVSL